MRLQFLIEISSDTIHQLLVEVASGPCGDENWSTHKFIGNSASKPWRSIEFTRVYRKVRIQAAHANPPAAIPAGRLGDAPALAFVGELKAKGVDLYLHQQAIDTSTPSGKAMFQMCGVFAEFEREIIRERVCSGLAGAKAQGKTLGRPP
jgi:Resolvase, N terminal domain